jgi:hypothetical protein
MKGALTSKEDYRFDEKGNLVGSEDDTPESLFLKESIVLYVEGFSSNHPADVAASNDPAGEIPPEALETQGSRSSSVRSEKSEANDSNDPSFSRDENKDGDESHDDDDNLHKSKRSNFRRK